jgi:holo-[acyl-carrier protein] synthase
LRIIGIGTDIVQIERIRAAMERHGESFARRILHSNEYALFLEKPQPALYLAKRFAAKEAVAKALGTGIAQGVSFEDIETFNNKAGKPEFCLHGKSQQKAVELGVTDYHLSLSDEQDYAVAYVLLTG